MASSASHRSPPVKATAAVDLRFEISLITIDMGVRPGATMDTLTYSEP
jgi:hypothetical protein